MPKETKETAEKVTMSFYLDVALAHKLVSESEAERRSISEQVNLILEDRYSGGKK